MGRSGRRARGAAPRRTVAAMMALVGAGLTWFLVNQDVQNFAQTSWADLPLSAVVRGLVFMAVGGALVGGLLAGLFGRSGLAGWALAAVGGVAGTVLGCLLGTLLSRVPDLLTGGPRTADLVSLAAGFLLPVLAMAAQPLLAVAWLAVIVLTHVLALRAR